MTVFVGDDWAEAHHDVHLMNESGDRLAAAKLAEGLEGIARLHALVADHVEDPAEVVIGIETERGLWVQALVAAGYQVYAINPLSVSRYRDRHNVAGTKSDSGDAKVLDSALGAGLDLPYACKGGVCCTCRAKMLEGRVEMEKNFTLEDWEIEQGFVLTCQARPLTQRVVVSYDDR